MVEAVQNPCKEGMHFEENTALAELVELRIAIKEPGRYELVKYAHDEWGKDCEKNIVQGQRPGFKYDLPRERVLERELSIVSSKLERWKPLAHTQNCVIYNATFL